MTNFAKITKFWQNFIFSKFWQNFIFLNFIYILLHQRELVFNFNSNKNHSITKYVKAYTVKEYSPKYFVKLQPANHFPIKGAFIFLNRV
jgi:hypothetical protein